jgi:nitroimidazol reductase NimA-like FMN-containing flavoprotein (pyridoxamine 5'-phosphate oxidase superfamily)
MTEQVGGPLNASELDEFLGRALLLKLGCLRPDGWPYIIPLWYAWYQHKLYVVGRERAVWLAYIRREPRVGVLIDEEDRRHRRVQMSATAAIVEGPTIRSQFSHQWREVNNLLAQRYMADNAGVAYAQLTADRPRVLVEIRPVQISSWRGGPWHHRYYDEAPASPPPTAIFEQRRI